MALLTICALGHVAAAWDQGAASLERARTQEKKTKAARSDRHKSRLHAEVDSMGRC